MDHVLENMNELKAQPIYMTKMEMPEHAIDEFQMKKEKITQKKSERLWNYERVAKKGFMAMTFATYKDEDVLKQEDFVKLSAYAHYLCQRK